MLTTSYVEVSLVEIQRGEHQAQDMAMDDSISAMVYVPHFNLLMTGDLSGSISAFDMSTGEKVLEYRHGHQNAAVTAMGISANGHRLISGGSDGELLVWNILSGTILQKLVRPKSREITGIFSCMVDKIFATGWGGKLACFYAGEPVDLSRCPVDVDTIDWGPPQHGDSDVHVTAHVGETMLCTGSDNGNIAIWDLRLGKRSRLLNIKAYLTKLVYRSSSDEADEDGYVHKVKQTQACDLLWCQQLSASWFAGRR
jgi:WD40 repeat protein